MANNVERPLLRVVEVAQLLGLGRSRTYALVAARELPSVRIAGRVWVPRKALERWLERQAVRALRSVRGVATASR